MNDLYRSLPVSLNVGGTEWDIRSDYADILYAISFFGDPDFEADDAWYIAFNVIFKDFEHMPKELYKEAAQKVADFIDMGMKDDEHSARRPRTMDWDQDAALIISAINKVAGQDIRTIPHVHWWTFMSYYMEIGDGLFSQIVSIRQKKTKGKKLEKWEQEFYQSNRKLIDLRHKISEEQQEEIDALNKLLG